MERGILILRSTYMFDHQHQELLPEFKIPNRFQHLLIIQSTILNVLANPIQVPPFPFELFFGQENECAEFLGLFPAPLPEFAVVGEVGVE